MRRFQSENSEIPKIGLGTAKLKGSNCRSVVRDALEEGYRHIDTAQMYGNENEVGKAVQESSVDRSEVFITTKLLRTNLNFDSVIESTKKSLERLETSYIDLLLIHAPSPKVPIEETLEAMNQLQGENKVRKIGVSNFSSEELKKAIDSSRNKIVTNQVRYNPYVERDLLLSICRENGVALTAYSPLEHGELVGNENLRSIGDRYNKTSSQVALRWLIEQDNVVAIPKASSRAHLRENINIFDFSLTETEKREIAEISPSLSYRIKRTVKRFI